MNFVISVAAQLAGMHPQTLRQYDRLGLVTPDRAGGKLGALMLVVGIAFFGWLFFGEAVRAQVWLGAVVIFAACVWAGRAGRPRPEEVPVLP